MESKPILRLKNLTKKYDGVLALDSVTLDFMEGEIHALAGENGAGKSTMIKMIAGAISPTSGTIEIAGEEFDRLTPSESRSHGVSVIYQEFNLVGELTISENIFLGRYQKKGLFLDKAAMEQETRQLFQSLEIDLNPNTKVKELSVAYQQMVEIVKAMSQNAKILIMDEPSAPLTNNEVELMFRLVRKLNDKGVTILYITHRLEEIFQMADRVTVLRDGMLIETLDTAKTNQAELVHKMIGRELQNTFPPHESCATNSVVMQLKDVCGNGDYGINLELYKGEILGIGGLVGSGRTELAEMLFGIKRPESGEILCNGTPYTPKSPRRAIQNGIVLIPEDRKKHGVLLSLSALWNVSLPNLRKLSRRILIDRRQEAKLYDHYHDTLHIKASSPRQLARNLSGGNQQKVVLAKWLARNPQVIIFDEPTRGIDIAAKYEIYRLMIQLVQEGKSIIMISSELPELLGMSDRIVVMSKGRVSGVVHKEDFSQENVLNCAFNIE